MSRVPYHGRRPGFEPAAAANLGVRIAEQNKLKVESLAAALAERPEWMPARGSDPLDPWCEPCEALPYASDHARWPRPTGWRTGQGWDYCPVCYADRPPWGFPDERAAAVAPGEGADQAQPDWRISKKGKAWCKYRAMIVTVFKGRPGGAGSC